MADAAEKSPEKATAASGGIVARAAGAAGVFAAALAAVLIGGFINAKLHPVQEYVLGPDGKLTLKPEPKAAAEEHKPEGGSGKPAQYYSFDPPLVVNFDDTQAVRFLQLQIDVMARDEKVIEAVKGNSPAIRNNLLMLMNNRDYKVLMTREGKEALRQECLKEVQRILKKETGSTGVEDLYFSSFVVQ
ncbi:MAG TPA: flagellar basal body-associated FliL family protein [Steroidobacteraceae bacterium]|nr:flagellar basal body-associated FliL family protein [Steroidobacteraceae bacterium]